MNAIALAFPFTATSITGGACRYSPKRSAQVLSTSEWTRTIFPEMSPAFLNSCAVPIPTSKIGTCCAGTRAGAHAIDTARTRNSTLGIELSLGSIAVPVAETLIWVAPSAHEAAVMKSSVWTLSAPAVLNASTPHSTARCMAGVPGTRPPISSVRWRRLVSRDEGLSASLIRRVASDSGPAAAHVSTSGAIQ